ncbi:hypothetical protein FXO37_21311 [Capsicum annuum]|nr:hypothetical protein FXO37_21311 [Capsicum annuum]
MNFGPYFSLGLTQFQSISNEIDISGFVLSNFDYKDVDFCENRFKYRNDPTIIKKLRDAASAKGKKPAVAISKEKRKEVVKRDPLPKGMKYVIKTVSHHQLRFDISYNRNFMTDVEYFVDKKVLNMFKETCFGVFVDMPKSNFQAINFLEFKIVEDGRYEQYPWGKIAFNKLMNSLRQGFFIEKQLYGLEGMPYVLNYVYTNISPTVDEMKCLQLSNHASMNLQDSVNSTLPFISCRKQKKVDHKAILTADSLPSDDFDDFTTPSSIEIVTKSKARSDRSLTTPSKRRKTDAKQKKLVTVQEKIKAHPSVKKVNVSPSGTSKSIPDPINEEAPHEASLMDFGEQIPPIVTHKRESTQKINVPTGINHEQVLLKVCRNAIESFIKAYVGIDIDSSTRDAKKNETYVDELKTLKEQPKDILDKNDDGNFVSTENHKRDEEILTESSLKFNFDDPTIPRETIEVQNVQKSIDLLQKENLPDLILPIDNIEVRNESQVSNTEISSDAFQESVDDIITGIFSPIVVISIDNIIAEISTPVITMQIKSVSPKEIKDSECHIHDSQFPSVLPEADLGKQDDKTTHAPRNRNRTTIFSSSFTTKFTSSCKGKEFATVDFPRKHLFDGCLIFQDGPTRLIEQYCD